ncbi:Caa(3)-type oxidase subunit IV [Bordetella petrii]|nr:Caa(3)-type oxidase subunit IV [Bordetella petrii]
MKPARTGPHPPGLRRALRAHCAVWLLLLALLGLTVAGAGVALGPGNAALSTAIALIKAALVLAYYMHLRHAPPTLRAVLATALLALLVLAALSGIDLGTRG